MKRMLFIVLTGLLLLTFCACESDQDREEKIRQEQMASARENLNKIDGVQEQSKDIQDLIDKYKG